MEKNVNYWEKYLANKNRQANETCAQIRRDEFRLVVNHGKSAINWKLYN